MRFMRTFVALCFLGLAASAAQAQAIRSGFNSSTLPGNDDGSTGAVNFGFAANFFGTTYTQLWVNNNGNVTFNGPRSTFTPFDLDNTLGIPIIAPFFGDVDTRNAIPDVTYGTGTVGGRAAFGVNWLGVGYFSLHATPANFFQLVMIDRSDVEIGAFDFEFNYGSIGWEVGDFSDGTGTNGNGLCDVGESGCNSARVGWTNGTAGNSFELAGSGVHGAFVNGGSNELQGDRYLFQVRNGIVSDPTTVPEPATLTLVGTGLFGLAAAARRRRRNSS